MRALLQSDCQCGVGVSLSILSGGRLDPAQQCSTTVCQRSDARCRQLDNSLRDFERPRLAGVERE